MTALMPDRSPPAEEARSAAAVRRDLRHRRPLAATSLVAGAVAAAAPLVVLLAVGVTGWFLTDAGVHGAPRDGLQIGALAWLMAHASGVQVAGAAVTVIPLGITAICAWSMWRLGHRLGDAISAHGPDADRIADGERDWTVWLASSLFAFGYLGVVVGTHRLAADAETVPSLFRAVVFALVLSTLVAVPAIASGSGRASVWLAGVPRSVLATAQATRSIAATFGWVALATFAVALVLDLDTAFNLVSQVGTNAAGTLLLVLVCCVLVPNAAAFSGAYVLGPGFTVGVLTIVSPAEVSVGALPLFPMLAALPDPGPTPGWAPWLVLLPPAVAMWGAFRAHRRWPTLRYDQSAIRGCAGGMLAGLGFTLVAVLAGGAVGPGRMTDVGPLVGPVLVHSLTAFGLGGLIGGLAATWWQRRGAAQSA